MRGLTALIASRRVDFPVRRNAFSRWKYQQVESVHLRVAGHPDDPRTGWRPQRPDGRRVRGGGRGAHCGRPRPSTSAARFSCRRDARSSATWVPLVPHKGQLDLVDAVAALVRDVPDVRVLNRRRRRIAQRAGAADPPPSPGGARHPDRIPATTSPSLLRGLDLFVMSSVTEGPRERRCWMRCQPGSRWSERAPAASPRALSTKRPACSFRCATRRRSHTR